MKDWRKEAAERATKVFPRHGRLKSTAVMLAGTHPWAIDYIEQAPVLVPAMMGKSPCKSRLERAHVSQLMADACRGGVKLRDLMRSYDLSPPLRKIFGRTISLDNFWVIRRIASIAPSTLSQSIPPSASQQSIWLSAITVWLEHLGVRSDSDRRLHINGRPIPWIIRHSAIEWAVMAFAAANPATVAGRLNSMRAAQDLADLALRDTFDFSWSLEQAMAAMARWHQNLADQSNAYTRIEEVSYAPLPETITVDGYEFVALRSNQALFEEGRAMHHCVSSYWISVVSEGARIYSVRKDGGRVATIELRPVARWLSGDEMLRPDARAFVARSYRTEQMRGPCNSGLPAEVHWAARNFLEALTGIADQPSPNPKILGVDHGVPHDARIEFGPAPNSWEVHP